MRSVLPFQEVAVAALGCAMICGVSCHIVADLEDHQPNPSRVDAGATDATAEARDGEAGSSAEAVCNHADDDGDGLVDEGLVWQATGWRTLLHETGVSEVAGVRLVDDLFAFAALATRFDGASTVRLGLVDEVGSPRGESVMGLDWLRIHGWGVAFDAAHQEVFLAFVEASHRELHVVRFAVDETRLRGTHTDVVPLGYPVSKLFDVGWTEHGPVVLVRGTDGYARAEWTDRLDQTEGWNRKLASIKPDAAKLSVGPAVAWVASGMLDTGQYGVMGGMIALDGAEEVCSARQVVSAGGGVWPEILATGTPAMWQDDRLWFTTTDSVKVAETWNVRISALDSATVACALAPTGTFTDASSNVPVYGHSLAWAFGNAVATSAAKNQVRIHRLGPRFESVTPRKQPLVVDDALAHALVGGSGSPLLFRVRASTGDLDVTQVGCP